MRALPSLLGATRRSIIAVSLLAFCGAALATPPAHAPAHGWRKKHDPDYVGYTGHKWPADYGVLSGRCYRERVGAVLGGAVGGAIGGQVARPEDRAVAIVVGAVIGTVIGAKIGRDIDRTDRACIGHALDLARPGQRVEWVGASGVRYAIVPAQPFQWNGRLCRDFASEVVIDGALQRGRGKACQAGSGEWTIVS
jgi:surface antigen